MVVVKDKRTVWSQEDARRRCSNGDIFIKKGKREGEVITMISKFCRRPTRRHCFEADGGDGGGGGSCTTIC